MHAKQLLIKNLQRTKWQGSNPAPEWKQFNHNWPVCLSVRECPLWNSRLSSEPVDMELLMRRLNGLTTSRVHINTHRVTRIRSGSPVNAGGLVTHSNNNATQEQLVLWQQLLITSVKSNLAKGRIVDWSLIAATNVFIHLDPQLTWFFEPTSVSPQTASRSVHP